MKRLGIDIGRVLIQGGNEDGDFFSETYIHVPPVEDAIPSIAQIVKELGSQNVFLVSKCSESIQRKTLMWLEAQNFFKTTHMYRHQVLFCRDRKAKAEVVQEHTIDTFIDDRFAVLKHMLFLKGLYLFAPTPKELAEALNHTEAGHIQTVSGWIELLSILKNQRTNP